MSTKGSKGKAPGTQPTKRNEPSRSTLEDMLRRLEAMTDRPDGKRPAHVPLILRIRLDGSAPIPIADENPRLKHLSVIDRWAFLTAARIALDITPLEYLAHGSVFFQNSSAEDPAMREQWLIISRIMRALHYEAQENESAFLKNVDPQARSVLTRHGFDLLFSARAAAFVRIRDQVVADLQQNMESDTIASCILSALGEPSSHEIARHIPDLDAEMVHREIGSARYTRAKKALHRARNSKTAERDVTTQAECMIRAWLRAMECPDEIVKGAFDAERARNERTDGKRE